MSATMLGVADAAEQVGLLAERAQAALAAAAPALHLDGHGRAVPEPGEVHGAEAAPAHHARLVEPARQRLHLPPRQPPRRLLHRRAREREREQSRRGWQRRAGRPLDARTSPPPAPAQRAARSTRARVAAQVEAGGDIRGRASRLVRFARGGRWARRGRAGQDARRNNSCFEGAETYKIV